MSAENIEEEVRAIVAEILEEEPEDVKNDAHFVQDLGMDSMMALEILASIEKKFKVVVPEEMLPKFTSLNETVAIVTDLINKS